VHYRMPNLAKIDDGGWAREPPNVERLSKCGIVTVQCTPVMVKSGMVEHVTGLRWYAKFHSDP